MPTILRIGPYRFSFYAADRVEPVHVHVARDEMEAKYWLEPEIRLAYNKGYSEHESRAVERLVRLNREKLLRSWHDRINPA